MTYTLLGQTLHNTADRAKRWFANNYGATGFVCEKPSPDGLRLAPTWKARLRTGYGLYVNVQSAPFIPTLSDVVAIGVSRSLPIKLWVAVNYESPKVTFAEDLRSAANLGIGVVQFDEHGQGQEWQQAVALSLYALRKTDLSRVPKVRKEALKNAEATFLSGSPPEGCQAICQELEDITRAFAECTYRNGFWRTPAGAKPLKVQFFRTGKWAPMLQDLDRLIDEKAIRGKSPTFTTAKVAAARGFTGWRNSLSHKPKNPKELQQRDTKLRTMFEATRDLLLDWYEIAAPLKLIK